MIGKLNSSMFMFILAVIFYYGADVLIDFHNNITTVSIPFPESQAAMWFCVVAACLVWLPKSLDDKLRAFVAGKIKQFKERGKGPNVY